MVTDSIQADWLAYAQQFTHIDEQEQALLRNFTAGLITYGKQFIIAHASNYVSSYINGADLYRTECRIGAPYTRVVFTTTPNPRGYAVEMTGEMCRFAREEVSAVPGHYQNQTVECNLNPSLVAWRRTRFIAKLYCNVPDAVNMILCIYFQSVCNTLFQTEGYRFRCDPRYMYLVMTLPRRNVVGREAPERNVGLLEDLLPEVPRIQTFPAATTWKLLKCPMCRALVRSPDPPLTVYGQEQKCSVCYDAVVATLLPCGHACLCGTCFQRMPSS